MLDDPEGGIGPIDEGARGRRRRGWQRAAMILGLLLILLVAAGAVAAVAAMVGNPDRTSNIRDIVIIFMAAEALIIGLALVILIVQLARLTALLQNEVKPILDSTNDTLNTLRGTTTFLSNNLVEPVIKVNSTAAALRRALDLVRIGRRR